MKESPARRLLLRFSMTRQDFRITIDQTLDLTSPVAIFGPSGSGKTSVLRAISGLEHADHGQISLDGETWQDNQRIVPAHRRNVGYVFQDARLFSHLDVNGNLALAAHGATTDAGISKAAVVESLNIGSLLSRDTHSLSGGETQRVAIARTLLAQPHLLLMDEPVSSLDADSRHETIEYIASVTRTFDLPLLYVTHDVGEVARLAPATVLLEDGQVTASGPTPDVFAQIDRGPVQARAVSILTATVCGESSGLAALTIGQQQVHMAVAERSVGESVQLRVFATDVVIARRRIEDTSIRNILAGTISEIRSCAEGTAEIHIDIENQLLKAQVTRNAVDELGLSVGGKIYAMIKSVALSDSTRDVRA